MSTRAEALNRIDTALAEVGAIEASLAEARRGQRPGIDWSDLARRFHAIACADTGHHAFTPVKELAVLAGRLSDGADDRTLRTAEIEVIQHAADVLSLLLRDMGHQLLGCRGADVAPAATALRDRLEHLLVAASR